MDEYRVAGAGVNEGVPVIEDQVWSANVVAQQTSGIQESRVVSIQMSAKVLKKEPQEVRARLLNDEAWGLA
jgi:hypothetical protein